MFENILKNKTYIECDDILPRNQKDSFKRYVDVELKRLTDNNIIPKSIKKFCHKHNYSYESKPLTIFTINNVILYTDCERCEYDLMKERENGYNQAELKRKEQEAILTMQCILIARGVSEKFLLKEMDYSKGLFSNFSHLLQGVLKSNLIIIGGIGSGKSSFIYEICKSYYKLDKIGEVINANVLLSKFKSNFSSVDFLKESYKNVDCLCIDEIDEIKSSDYLCLDEIIKLFYDGLKKLVFVGNINVDDFRSMLSPKSLSRLKNNTIIINAGNNDLR